MVVFRPSERGTAPLFVEARLVQQGGATLFGLSPGRYAAVAIALLDPSILTDPAVATALQNKTISFEVQAGSVASLDVPVAAANDVLESALRMGSGVF